MPFRSWKMYGFIFGFQRRVWCPKWTPASRRARMETPDAIVVWFLSEPAAAVRGAVMDAFAPGLRPGEVPRDAPGEPRSPGQPAEYTTPRPRGREGCRAPAAGRRSAVRGLAVRRRPRVDVADLG